ncbi:MAG TPA: nucleoside-diphosphate sugar epimerase, partial [Pseudomonas sp.]|nr:nucleoside-diphosphate sugar epimerase [Pseudomonas sp.]
MTERQLLIAGASGIIGQAVLEAFAKTGWSITTVGRSKQAPSRFPHLTADLLDSDSLSAAKA